MLDTVFTAAHESLLSDAVWADHGWPMVTLAALGAALMGALIVSRSARHPVGWLLLALSLASVSMAAGFIRTARSRSRWCGRGGR